MKIDHNISAGLACLVLAAVTVACLACGSSAAPAGDATSSNTLEAPKVAADLDSAAAADFAASAPATAATASKSDSVPRTASETIEPEATARPTLAPTKPLAEWEQELRSAQIYPGSWKTDFSKRSVPYNEIFSGGVPRDGIPPLDNPSFTSVQQADAWLEAKEPVISFELNGEAKAYPLQILTWHEIVNDTVGGVPVVATFCPLCNSAIVFDRRLGDVVYDFGVSGNLRNSDLIMWDRQTESWWQQLTGDAIVGELTGENLNLLPATIISWEDFRDSHPDALVLSRETGFSRNYGFNPYVGYDRVDKPPFLFFGAEDDRLLPMERVAAFTLGDSSVAFPFPLLETEGVIHHTIDGKDLVIFFKPGTRSALDGSFIGESKEVGATGVFERGLDGQRLTFRALDSGFEDEETGSRWNILGQAVAGPLTGQQLIPVIHANHFWFAWAAFRPNTEVFRGTT